MPETQVIPGATHPATQAGHPQSGTWSQLQVEVEVECLRP